MDDNVQLSELQCDAITELLNIGMGTAAHSLSQMVNEEVKLSIPSLEVLSRQQVANYFSTQPQQEIAAIKQHFYGPFWGEALLLFPEKKRMELVRTLIKGEFPPEILAELEQDALIEVGNIILNACLSSLANILTTGLNSDLPIFLAGTAIEILTACDSREDEIVMFLRMDFTLQTKDIEGYVAFILEIPAVEQFKANIDKYLKGFGHGV
jgi:chemotaxis protein CheC